MHAIETIIQRYCPKIISFIGKKRKRNLFKRKDHRVEEKFCFISTRIEKKIHENLMYPISDSVKETKRRNLGRELAQLENLSRNPVKGIFTNLEDARIPTLQKKDPRFERKLSATRKSSIMYSTKRWRDRKDFRLSKNPVGARFTGVKNSTYDYGKEGEDPLKRKFARSAPPFRISAKGSRKGRKIFSSLSPSSSNLIGSVGYKTLQKCFP